MPDPKDPIEWAPLREHRRHTCLQCEAVFERHRDDLDPAAGVDEAVVTLYEAWDDEHGGGADQGAVYVFAYLLERDGVASVEDWSAVEPDSLVARRPDPAGLERLFWERERVPWWLAVRYGVHYSLVQYWMAEADVPLMWRNLSPALQETLR